MQGMIPVKDYTSAAEMRAAHAATRARLMNPRPKKPQQAVVVQLFPAPLPEPSPEDMAAHEKRILEFVSEMTSGITPRDFMRQAARAYGVGMRSIICQDRTYPSTLIRQKITWMVKEKFPRLSYPKIAELFERDHTTVLHSIRKIDALIAAKDPRVAELEGMISDE